MEQSFKLADIPNSFTFYLRNEPIIVINEDGFKYKGELIEDGGEIYKLLNEFLRTPQLPKHPPVFSENGNELFFDEEGNLIKEFPKQEITDEQAIKMLQDMNKQPMRFHCVPKEISDEEIEKAAEPIEMGIHRMFFKTGAKWYREQLKHKQ